jgi:two-component system, LytTR family, response regulator
MNRLIKLINRHISRNFGSMRTYKCLIADDNLLDRDALEMYIGKITNLHIEAICSNGLEAAAILKQKEIDIVFTDIDMPGLSGIELIQSITNPPAFIFISAHDEYAAESYTLDVIDYIVKPVSLGKIQKAANKAMEYLELRKLAASYVGPANSTAEIKSRTISSDHFFIKEDKDYTRIDTANLLFIESMGNFSKLQTLEKKHLTLVSLKNMEMQLPVPDFMRIHKQYIINLQHIVSVSSSGDVLLNGGYSIPLGELYKAALMEFVNNKMMLR